jgi:hypothetical protein
MPNAECRTLPAWAGTNEGSPPSLGRAWRSVNADRTARGVATRLDDVELVALHGSRVTRTERAAGDVDLALRIRDATSGQTRRVELAVVRASDHPVDGVFLHDAPSATGRSLTASALHRAAPPHERLSIRS